MGRTRIARQGVGLPTGAGAGRVGQGGKGGEDNNSKARSETADRCGDGRAGQGGKGRGGKGIGGQGGGGGEGQEEQGKGVTLLTGTGTGARGHGGVGREWEGRVGRTRRPWQRVRLPTGTGTGTSVMFMVLRCSIKARCNFSHALRNCNGHFLANYSNSPLAWVWLRCGSHTSLVRDISFKMPLKIGTVIGRK